MKKKEWMLVFHDIFPVLGTGPFPFAANDALV
jgi:hypothetical protein